MVDVDLPSQNQNQTSSVYITNHSSMKFIGTEYLTLSHSNWYIRPGTNSLSCSRRLSFLISLRISIMNFQCVLVFLVSICMLFAYGTGLVICQVSPYFMLLYAAHPENLPSLNINIFFPSIAVFNVFICNYHFLIGNNLF